MPVTDTTRALTVRLPEDLYVSATMLAKKSRVSLNTIIQNSLTQAIRVQEEREMYEAATLLGTDTETTDVSCDVSWALAAQAEVVLHDEF